VIYFIDENLGEAEAWAIDLRMNGFEIVHIRNADQAYSQLVKANNYELVIIDVMLAADDNDRSPRYTRDRTDDYLLTGIVFVDDLAQACGHELVNRCVFLSQTGEDRLIKEIEQAARRHDIPFWRKFEFSDPSEFTAKVRNRLSEIVGESRR